jgi:hypothetical protein
MHNRNKETDMLMNPAAPGKVPLPMDGFQRLPQPAGEDYRCSGAMVRIAAANSVSVFSVDSETDKNKNGEVSPAV